MNEQEASEMNRAIMRVSDTLSQMYQAALVIRSSIVKSPLTLRELDRRECMLDALAQSLSDEFEAIEHAYPDFDRMDVILELRESLNPVRRIIPTNPATRAWGE